jgi:hypothetical protein
VFVVHVYEYAEYRKEENNIHLFSSGPPATLFMSRQPNFPSSLNLQGEVSWRPPHGDMVTAMSLASRKFRERTDRVVPASWTRLEMDSGKAWAGMASRKRLSSGGPRDGRLLQGEN